MKRELVERELTTEGPRRAGSAQGKRRTVTVNVGESPLAWPHARGHLDDRLFDAGEALRGDYERAQLSANVTMRWDPVRVKSTGERGLTPTERQVAAKRRFDEAIAPCGQGARRHSLARGVRERGASGCRKGARLAGAQRQAGAADRARTGGGVLPDKVSAHASASATARRSRGRVSASNQGCFAIHRRARQAGWGRGKKAPNSPARRTLSVMVRRRVSGR